jgi:TRAP-type C4-dicarboxylate transport system permease small subunit
MKVINYITRAGAVASGILIGVTMMTTVYDVFMRNLFQPTVWSQPLSEMFLVYCAFLGAAWCLQHEGHVRFTIVMDRLNPDKRALMNCINSAMGLIICLVLFWQSCIMFIGLVQSGSTPVVSFPIPDWVRYVTLPFGSLFLSIHFGKKIYDYGIIWKKHKKEDNLPKETVTIS